MEDTRSVSSEVPPNKRRKKFPVSQIAQRLQTTKIIAKEWIRDISKRSANDPVYQFETEHTPSPFLIGRFEIKYEHFKDTNPVVLNTPLGYWSHTPKTNTLPIKYRCSACTNIIEPGVVQVLFNPAFSLPYLIICNTCF